VLLVDDDDEVREVTAAHLVGLGHSLYQASNGLEALDLLDSSTKVDLLVADFAMPGMTGMDLAVQARAKSSGLPALIVTGHASLEEIPEGVAVLEKPFTEQQLSNAIVELLSASPGRRD